MKTYDTLDQFLYDLTWSDNVRHKLRVTADRDDVRYLVAWDNAGKLSASAYTSEPAEWPATVVAAWRKPTLPELVKSKTQRAVDLVREGVNPNAAAKQCGVHPSAVYRALTRAQEKPLCPCCGQVVREGFAIKTPSAAPASA